MLHQDITLPPGSDRACIEALIERVCRADGLGIGLKETLRQYPGSLHWHWKRSRERGTLEMTYWPGGNRLWISVHENRAAPWTDEAAARLVRRLEECLPGEVGMTFAQENTG